jgi:hypothetical protein
MTVVLESKEQMKARGLDSPDDGDALALTFAAPVEPEAGERDDEDEIDMFGGRVSNADAWMLHRAYVSESTRGRTISFVSTRTNVNQLTAAALAPI